MCEYFDEAPTTEDTKVQFIRRQIHLYGSPCEELIHSYYVEVMKEYPAKCQRKFGILTVAAEFHDNGLRLSVLNGRDLQPHPSKVGKKPDTYVEIQFIFNKVGVHIKSLKTKTQNKNEFPLYDEAFTM